MIEKDDNNAYNRKWKSDLKWEVEYIRGAKINHVPNRTQVRAYKNKVMANQLSRSLKKNATKAELFLLNALNNRCVIIVFQKPLWTADRYVVVDFFLINARGEKYVIEVDGAFHNGKKYKKRDVERTEYLWKKHKCTVHRFSNREVFKDREFVVDRILDLNPRFSSFKKKSKVRILPEGLKGDGTYVDEVFGYTIGRIKKGGKYRNNRCARNARQI